MHTEWYTNDQSVAKRLRRCTEDKVDILKILTGKTKFYSIQYKNGWLAASDRFDLFT